MIFRRPLLPCLLAYLLGLWLAQFGGALTPWLWFSLLGVFCVGAAAVCLKLRATVFLLLLGIMLIATQVMRERHASGKSAIELATDLGDSKLRQISGRIEAIRSFGEGESERCELNNVSISSGSAVVQFPGKVLLGITLQNREGTYSRISPRLDLVPGDTIRVLANIRPNEGFQNFFGFDRIGTLSQQGIYASATVTNPKLIQRSDQVRPLRARISHVLTGLRRWCRLAIDKNMARHDGKLMVAMLFNDTRLLSNTDQKIFRDSATFHLFAVSGLHIAIMALALTLFFRCFRLSSRTSWTLAVVLLFFYLWLIDFVVPATRAWLMVATFVGGLWLKREVDGFSSLLFSIAIIVLGDPMAPWQVGFQLSVLGVAAIVLLVPFMKEWRKRVEWKQFDFIRRYGIDPVIESAIVTAAVTMVLFPLELHYFFQFNWLSPIANLVQASMSTIVIASGMVVLAAAAVWAPAAQVFGHGASVLMNLLYQVSESTANADWAIWRTGTIPAWLVFLYLAILMSGYYLSFRDTPEFRLKSRARFVTHGTCCMASVLFWWMLAVMPGSRMNLFFFDVGQGDSTLVMFPNGQTMLVDAGKELPDMGKLVVEPQLKALGIKKIDYLIATHPDEDHIGGIPTIMENFAIGALIEPDNLGDDNPIMARMHSIAARNNVPVIRTLENSELKGLPVQVKILNPPAGSALNMPDNDKSVVVSLQFGSFSCLLMADAEIPVEEHLLHLNEVHPVTVLKVGHHGSKTSSGEAFLTKAQPKVAVVSCGKHNRFGHPNPQVMARLHNHCGEILRTDVTGAVQIVTNGATVKIRSAADYVSDSAL